MNTSRIGTKVAAIVAATLLVGGIAWAQIAGVVTEVTPRAITVSGARYPITENTVVEDLGHQPITWPEVRPGVSVELEFDEEGALATVRAAVVR